MIDEEKAKLLRHVIDFDGSLKGDSYRTVFHSSCATEWFQHYEPQENDFVDTYYSAMFYYAKEHFVKYHNAPSDDLIRDELLHNEDLNQAQKLEITEIFRAMSRLEARPGDCLKLVDDVKETYIRAYLIQTTKKIAKLGSEAKPSGLLAATIRNLGKLSHSTASNVSREAAKPKTAAELADLYESKFNSPQGISPVAFRFGFPTLDLHLRGISLGDRVAIIGAPNVGKSFFMAHLGYDALVNSDKRVIFASCEMDEAGNQARLISYLTGISSTKISSGQRALDSEEVEKVIEGYKILRSFGDRVLFCPKGSFDNMHTLHGLITDAYGSDYSRDTIVCLDYLDRLKANRKVFGGDHDMIKAVSIDVEDFTNTTNFALVTPSQMSSDNVRKGTSDAVPGYVQIQRDFDIVLTLTQTKDNPYIPATATEAATPAVIELKVSKSRNSVKLPYPVHVVADFATATLSELPMFKPATTPRFTQPKGKEL